jgi:hypothetical protein
METLEREDVQWEEELDQELVENEGRMGTQEQKEDAHKILPAQVSLACMEFLVQKVPF